MNATIDIHETQAAAKPDVSPAGVSRREREIAQVEACHAAALAASKGFPALREIVTAWYPLRLREAELKAAHGDVEEGIAEGDEQAADDAWHEAEDSADAMAMSILDLPPQANGFGAARLDMLAAFYPGIAFEEMLRWDGIQKRLLSILRADLVEPPAQPVPDSSRQAWEAAREAYEVAEQARDAVCERGHGYDAGDASLDAVHQARGAMLAQPAPDGTAFAYKLANLYEAPDFRRPEEVAYAEEGSDIGASELLTLYREALTWGALPLAKPNAACPVAAILPNFTAVSGAELAADAHGDAVTLDAMADQRRQMTDRIAGMTALSVQGAVIQMALSGFYAELVRGCTDEADRDHFHTLHEQLHRSAMGVFAAYIPEALWVQFIGGAHPGGAPSISLPEDDAALVAADPELEGLIAEIDAGWCRDEDDEATKEAKDAALQPLYRRLGQIERDLLGRRATTTAGLKVKARLAAYGRQYDVDYGEVDSLLLDLCHSLGVPPPVRRADDLFEEYEQLGGKITALSGDDHGPMIGVSLAPPSTRAREIEALLNDDEIARQVRQSALDAHGLERAPQIVAASPTAAEMAQ